jgi:hypothetical protein
VQRTASARERDKRALIVGAWRTDEHVGGFAQARGRHNRIFTTSTKDRNVSMD